MLLAKPTVVLVAALLISGCAGNRSSETTLFEGGEGPAFGHATSCDIPDPGENLVEFSLGTGEITTLASDGLLLTTSASRGLDSDFTSRRLTAEGVDAVVGAIAGLGLTAGCRYLYAPEDRGAITATTDAGMVYLYWGPYLGAYPGFELMRVPTPQEEAAVTQLRDQIANLDGWLPSGAFVGSEGRFDPDRWMVTVVTYSSGQSPGDRLGFPGGKELWGSNPDFAGATLHDGRMLSEFECAIVDRSEAVGLAESLDVAAHDVADGAWHVMSEDLRVVHVVGVAALLPGDSHTVCDGLPRPTVHVEADTQFVSPSDTDPCAVLPSEAASDLLDADEMVTRPARLPFADYECRYSTTRLYDWPVEIATVSLLPQNLTPQEAHALAEALFGAGMVERPVLDQMVWSNACWSVTLVCPPAVAMWTDPFLVLMTFPSSVFASQVSEETAIELAAAVLSRSEG